MNNMVRLFYKAKNKKGAWIFAQSLIDESGMHFQCSGDWSQYTIVPGTICMGFEALGKNFTHLYIGDCVKLNIGHKTVSCMVAYNPEYRRFGLVGEYEVAIDESVIQSCEFIGNIHDVKDGLG